MQIALPSRAVGLVAALGRAGRFAAETGRAGRDVRTWLAPTLVQLRRLGVDSLPVALFIAAFAGIVLALLSSYSFQGSAPIYLMGAFVQKALFLELAPVLTGLALAGRVSANIAAELGTMKVTEQVDALETLAYNPISYLVVPRVLAGIIMMPVVVALAIAVGVVASWVTAVTAAGVSSHDFVRGLRLFYQHKDVWFPLVKSVSFGATMTFAGCWIGLSTRGGAVGVGRAATRAVVVSAVLILVLDAFWAFVLL